MAAANLAELAVWARELLERAPRAHLAYLDDRDRARVLPVTYAVAGEDLWTAIDAKPKSKRGGEVARVRCLRRRPEAALCADHYEDDWTRLAWVQVVGSVEILDGDGDAPPQLESALAALRAKYERYADEPPGGPFLRLRPERVLSWRAAGG